MLPLIMQPFFAPLLFDAIDALEYFDTVAKWQIFLSKNSKLAVSKYQWQKKNIGIILADCVPNSCNAIHVRWAFVAFSVKFSNLAEIFPISAELFGGKLWKILARVYFFLDG